MPPRGVRPGTKRARQYDHIKQSEKDQGASNERAEEIAARTVNKERAQEARKLGVDGRSKMNKSQLRAAVDARG